MVVITEAQLKVLAPKCQNTTEWVVMLNKHLPIYSINTPRRIAAFLAQYLYETSGFTKLVESTNYTSVERLMEIFPKYFPSTTIAKCYVGKPINIANRVYANRYGNGDEWSGDGSLYRGRGLCHLTFKDNYKAFAKASGVDVVKSPELLEKPDCAVRVGCWYWDNRKLNLEADRAFGDGLPEAVKRITKAVNGGLNGYAERLALHKKALEVLGVKNA